MVGLLNGAKTTIQIESTDIRVLSVKGNQVSRWDSIPLDAGVVRGGRVQDPEAVGRSVARAFDQLGYSRGRVVASASGLLAVSRVFKVPALKGKELGQAIESETRRLMHVSTDSIQVYTQIAERGPDGVLVFVLGVPVETIEREIKALEYAGVYPDSLDLKPLACLRAVRTPTCIVACLEWDSLDIVVAVDGLPHLIRSVALNLPPGNREAAFDAMVDELTRIVKFYNDSHRDRFLPTSAPIYLSGHLNGHAGVLSSLVLSSGHRVHPFVPPLRCPEDMPLPEYVVNMGLAMKRI